MGGVGRRGEEKPYAYAVYRNFKVEANNDVHPANQVLMEFIEAGCTARKTERILP